VARTSNAVKLSPDSAFLWIELASRHLDANQLPDAEGALQNAIRLDPDAAVAYVRLGYVYLMQGNTTACAEVSEKALAQLGTPSTTRDKRDAAYAHLNLAVAKGRDAQLDAAFTHLTEARKLGLDEFGELEKDPKLDKLRSDPRFASFTE
jgi:tetratricopeptide (TPR) repeat protein